MILSEPLPDLNLKRRTRCDNRGEVADRFRPLLKEKVAHSSY